MRLCRHAGLPAAASGDPRQRHLPRPDGDPAGEANRELWLEFGADYRSDAGVEASTPMEQAYPLLFLCSDAAAYVTGVTLIADAGYMTSGLTGAYRAATDAANFLAGRF